LRYGGFMVSASNKKKYLPGLRTMFRFSLDTMLPVSGTSTWVHTGHLCLP
jgi:hypothetical protein